MSSAARTHGFTIKGWKAVVFFYAPWFIGIAVTFIGFVAGVGWLVSHV